MSTTIDQRVVEMRFDNRQFESGVKTTMNSLTNLKSNLDLKGATKGLENVSSAAQKCDMSVLSNSVETVKAKFSAMQVVAITALSRITQAVLTASKKVASAFTIDPIKTGFSEYETQINSVQTILANTQKEGATLGQVSKALDELNLYADKTIYNFTEMTRNIGTFTAAGVKLDDSVSAIKGIANLAAISGSTSQQASAAMYQLSQALAAGRVSLMDWNSVVNAGMGGQVFQDALKQTAKTMGIAVDESVSFRESISATGGQQSWLTSEVLTKTLAQFTGDMTDAQLAAEGFSEAQIKQIQTQAKMANDAATKVKTFTQLTDTLKESAQSGWSQSWRTIVGDFEEAKEFYTNVSSALGDLINQSSEARNKLLTEGLSSGWDQFLTQGVADEEAYIARIKNVAKEQGKITDEMMDDISSFDDLQKEGLITAELLGEGLSVLSNDLKDLSDEQLVEMGYTKEQIDELNKLNEAVQNGTISMDEFVEKMGEVSGRENLIEALFNSGKALMSILTPISKGFRDVFEPLTGDQLYSFTESLKDFTAKLTLSEETSNNLRSTFKGLFAVLDIGRQIIVAVFNASKPLREHFFGMTGGILELTGSWGEWLYQLSETIEKSDVLNIVFSTITGFIDLAIEAGQKFVSFLKEKIAFPGFEVFHAFLERIHQRMGGVGEAAGSMKSGVITAVEMIGEAVAESKFLQGLTTVWEGIKAIVSGIASSLGGLVSGLVDALSSGNFNGVLDFINTGLFGGLLLGITAFIKGLKEPLDSFNRIMDNVVGILNGVKGTLEAYQTRLKADALIKIATAIGILAAAILVISLIDSDKLAGALGAITVLFADLMVTMALFGRVSGDIIGVLKTCTAMLAVSTAVLILASALKKIGSLSLDEMTTGLVGVLGLTAIMVGAAKVMSSSGPIIIKGATRMVIFSVAIKILASACEDLAALSWDEMIRGLVGVGALMTAVTLFINNTKFSGRAITTATGIVILSSAMLIMASACKDFAAMTGQQLTEGIISIGILLTQLAIFTKVTGKAKHVISTGIALVAVGGALKILASAMADFSSIPFDDLKVGLLALAASLGAITIALNFMPKNMIGIGLGLIAVSTALFILSSALKNMGAMHWEEIGRGLTVLGGSLTLLAGGLFLMTGTISGSIALLIAVNALLVLTPVLSILGAMSWESIFKGITSLALSFAVLGGAGLLLSPLVPTILALSGAIALIGVSVLGIGAGLMMAGAGLAALAVGFAALAAAGVAGATAVVSSLTVIITGIVSLIPAVIGKIGEGLIELCKVIAEGAPAIGKAFKAIVLTCLDVLIECIPKIADGVLSLVNSVLISLVKYTPSIVNSIFQFLIGVLNGIADNIPGLIQAAVNVLVAFFSGVVDALSSIDTEVLIKAIAGIGLLSGIMIALSAGAGFIPGAMLGVLGMGVVIAELALVLAAIGALAQIPGLQWLINEGGVLMQSIGVAIGSFIGGIVGGIMGGITSQFPKMGTDLSAFMTNLKPFLDGAKLIDPSTLDGVKALAETILLLTAANILEGLTSWFTGGSSMTKFGEELAAFGPYFKKYYGSIKGIDGTVVEASANASKALGEMAANLPNSGGVVSWFTGENGLTAFAEELVEFGPKLKEYAESVKGLDANVVVNSANAAKALGEMAANLPNSGGVVSWFSGENDLSTFAEELASFGPALKKYAESVRGLDADVVVNSANAAMALANMADNLPNQGGAVSWFTGDNTLSMFATELMAFGPSLKKYAGSVTGLDSNVITNSTNAASALSALADNLPNSGGLVSWFTGDNDLGTFGESLVSFGANFALYSSYMKDVDAGILLTTTNAAQSIVELQKSLPKEGGWFSDDATLSDFGSDMASFGSHFSTYYASISNVDTNQLSNVIDETNNLISMIDNMATIDTDVMSSFGDSLADLGNEGVDSFVDAFTGVTEKVTKAANTMLTAFVNAVEQKKATINTTFLALVRVALAAMDNTYSEFQLTGAKLIDQFIEGIISKTSLVNDVVTIMFSDVLVQISNQYQTFYDAGVYLVDGFADGITAHTFKAEEGAAAMAGAAAGAVEDKLDINSPSKVGYGIGGFFGLGFVNALIDYGKKAYNASSEMANEAKTGLSKAISAIRDMVDSGIDSQPTIRPVLDLSNVEEGASKLDALFSRTQASSISSKMHEQSTKEIQNGETTSSDKGAVYTFTQNNYSPKALSRLEIYRQTKNQISSMKGLVKV